MASKRHLEPLNAVLFHKLPRLEAKPSPGVPSMLCKPSPVPTVGPETHLGYKGSYFSCSQAEGQLLHCLLHRPHSPTGRPGAEQGKNHPMLDPLVAQDKWPGHQGHPPPLKRPLAVPRPVYAAPLCFASLGSRGGDTLQRGPGAVPAVPPPSPVTLSHYYTAFDKYHGPSAVPDQGKAPEIPTCIPDPWMKAHQEHPPSCYPQPPYPQTPGSFSYKAFGFVVNGKSPPFPSTYLKPPTSQSHYPGPVDDFVSRLAAPGTLPSLKAMGPTRDPDPHPLPPAGYLHPNPGFAFSPMDRALFTEHHSDGRTAPLEAHRGRAVTRHGSAFHPIHTPQKIPDGLLGPLPKGEAGYSLDKAMMATPVLCQQQEVKGGVGDATKEHLTPRGAICPQERLRDRQSGDVSPPSPPMPVINKVFSLAPYREYLEGTESSIDVPRDHPQGDTPAQNAGSGQKAAGIQVTPISPCDKGESCHQKVPEGPEAKPTFPEPPAGSHPGLQDSGGEPTPGDMALDLSLKKGLVTTGSSHKEEMLDPREKEGPLGQVEVGEDTNVLLEAGGDTKPQVPPNQAEVGEDTNAQVPLQLVEVSSRDRSHFQSSATFMFKKYKILRSWEHPCLPQSSSPLHTWQESPSTTTPQEPCHNAKPADISPALPQAPLPTPCLIPAQPCVANQGFSALHTSLCHIISHSVSASSPELLRDWLRRTEPGDTPTETPRSLPKPKNGSKLPELQKLPKGREIWLAFRDAAALLSKLLAQLEAFTFTRKCPFPYVLRAGAVFIPIHVVKEKLFPELPGASVDQVLQKHKVELRPTTLSEEKLLRELELKGCTSRMLKLLALKQLPDIYPDLLNLLWHHSIQQQLGSRSEVGQ
ncbi:uncharacterized protein C15orf39 homolog [Cyrtonyx montezumae]|uniref:uncharacterized protein C15orf39 homolog n=1 Tax=Cyrtonyx montezumae TaxID=9017 RepID=UPI0032DA3483